MIIVATSFTEGYPWGSRYAGSLLEACTNAEVRVFNIGREDVETHWVNRDCKARMCYTGLSYPGTRGEMAQHGHFLGALDKCESKMARKRQRSERDSDVIVFTDADMFMQRWFTDFELDWLEEVKEGEVLLGQNLYDGQTLEEESELIEPTATFYLADNLFPGWADMEARNCGVIVARRRTYERLYDLTRPLLPACYSCFAGYAAIQWLICYCVQKWLTLRELPRTIHVHGHVDPGPDVTFDEEGRAFVKGTMAVFRHAMNLDPHKNWETRSCRTGTNLTTDKHG